MLMIVTYHFFMFLTDLGNALTFDSVNPALFNTGRKTVCHVTESFVLVRTFINIIVFSIDKNRIFDHD